MPKHSHPSYETALLDSSRALVTCVVFFPKSWSQLCLDVKYDLLVWVRLSESIWLEGDLFGECFLNAGSQESESVLHAREFKLLGNQWDQNHQIQQHILRGRFRGACTPRALQPAALKQQHHGISPSALSLWVQGLEGLLASSRTTNLFPCRLGSTVQGSYGYTMAASCALSAWQVLTATFADPPAAKPPSAAHRQRLT